MHNRRNLYRVLQVQPDAPDEIIKSSYRTLMQKLGAHPDLGGDQWNAALINDAYSILSNPEKRAQYDAEQRSLKESVGPGARETTHESQSKSNRAGESAGSDPNDFFEHESDCSIFAPNYQANDPLVCAFCGTRNAAGDYQMLDEVCSHCSSPMRFVEAPTGQNRGSHRIEHQDSIRIHIDATRHLARNGGGSVTDRGEILDL